MSSFGIRLKNQLKDMCSVENSKAHAYFAVVATSFFASLQCFEKFYIARGKAKYLLLTFSRCSWIKVVLKKKRCAKLDLQDFATKNYR